MTDGYIKLWRKSLDGDMIKNHKLWVFWTWCLMKASHKVHKLTLGFQEIKLMPGEFVFGMYSASKELNMSVRNIRTILNSLKKHKNLTVKTTNKYSVITIMNWGIYQENNNAADSQNDKPLTGYRQTTDNKQECKECKEEEKEIDTNVSTKKTVSTKPKRVMISYTQEFENFFKMHPWHVTKEKAFKEWQQLSEDIKIKIMEVLPKQLQDPYLSRENFKYFCRPQAWLHQGRWEDELNQKPQSKYGQSNADAGQNRNGVYINPDRVFKETDSYDSE